LWDIRTNQRLDRERFGGDFSQLADAYQEVARRLGILPESGPADMKGPEVMQ
jgi:phosphoribosylaminoimidazole-succinocarboxamide synthase